jgi:predicted DNA-binding protein
MYYIADIRQLKCRHFLKIVYIADIMKTKTYSFRLEDSVRSKLSEVSKQTGVEESTIVRECVRAVVEHVEEVGSITFPINVIFPNTPVKMVSKTIQRSTKTKDSLHPSSESKTASVDHTATEEKGSYADRTQGKPKNRIKSEIADGEPIKSKKESWSPEKAGFRPKDDYGEEYDDK